jgi:hypothetical protein
MQRDGDAVWRDVDPLDHQAQYPRLLGRGELIPCAHRLESAEGSDAKAKQMANSSREQWRLGTESRKSLL